MPEIYQRQAFICKNKREGVYTFQASTEKVDSYGDIVVQKGIDLTTFKKNPIILYQHNAEEPIGKAVDVRIGKNGLEADIELAPPGVSSVIDTVRGLLEAGILKAVSIGFTSKEYEAIRNKDNGITGFKFLKSLLHEISVVSIPANDQALAIARSFNLSPVDTKQLFENSDNYQRQAKNRNRVHVLKLQNGLN